MVALPWDTGELEQGMLCATWNSANPNPGPCCLIQKVHFTSFSPGNEFSSWCLLAVSCMPPTPSVTNPLDLPEAWSHFSLSSEWGSCCVLPFPSVWLQREPLATTTWVKTAGSRFCQSRGLEIRATGWLASGSSGQLGGFR